LSNTIDELDKGYSHIICIDTILHIVQQKYLKNTHKKTYATIIAAYVF